MLVTRCGIIVPATGDRKASFCLSMSPSARLPVAGKTALLGAAPLGDEMISKTTTNGWVAETRVIARCVEMGYRVSIPFGDGAPYDFIVDTGEKILRVQVKKVYQSQDHWVTSFIKARSSNYKNQFDRHYTKSDCDYIVCYSCEYDIAYIFPIEIVSNVRQLYVYPDMEEEAPRRSRIRNWVSKPDCGKYREAWF